MLCKYATIVADYVSALSARHFEACLIRVPRSPVQSFAATHAELMAVKRPERV